MPFDRYLIIINITHMQFIIQYNHFNDVYKEENKNYDMRWSPYGSCVLLTVTWLASSLSWFLMVM